MDEEKTDLPDGDFELSEAFGNALDQYGDWLNSFDDDMTRAVVGGLTGGIACLLYTSPSPRDRQKSRMPSSA